MSCVIQGSGWIINGGFVSGPTCSIENSPTPLINLETYVQFSGDDIGRTFRIEFKYSKLSTGTRITIYSPWVTSVTSGTNTFTSDGLPLNPDTYYNLLFTVLDSNDASYCTAGALRGCDNLTITPGCDTPSCNFAVS